MMQNNIMKYFIPGYLLLLCFVIPFNFFVIGDYFGIGIQGAFYQYQVTEYGNGLIPITQNWIYVANGTYEGKTALSIVVWTIAAAMLATAAVATLMTHSKSVEKSAGVVCILMFLSGVGFLVSVMIQYGVFLQGPAGISIPIGIPLLFLFSWVGYTMRATFF